MFREQLSPRSVHPYQSTLVPRSHAQLQAAAQQRAQFPWLEHALSYQRPATDSSNSEVAYHVPHYPQNSLHHHSRPDGPSSPVYHSPYDEGNTWPGHRRPPESEAMYNIPQGEGYVLPQCDSSFSVPLCSGEDTFRASSPHRYSEPMGRSPIPPLPPASPDSPAIGGCGGHCPGFEYVCYYVLQIIFVVGVLTGISLCIAGSVLRRSNRGGDLGVLVYIGCLSSAVCGVLLGVQCCVRRDLRRRKRRTAHAHIPLRSMPDCCPKEVATAAQARPLLPSQAHLDQVYRPTVAPLQEVSGVPWWRRQDH